jgi:riboflavin synthase
MFTGLIETTGTVVSLKTLPSGVQRLTVAAPALAGRWKLGDSIAVNGVCLTAIEIDTKADPTYFAADLAQETIERTTLTRLIPETVVNLELPTPSGSPLGGHVVQGHVDGTGWIEMLVPVHPDAEDTDWRLSVEADAELAPYIVSQGSVTIDGISLTVAKIHDSHPDGSIRFDIAIIPHTYKSTNLHTLDWHTRVNIETDVLAKYAARRSTEPTTITVRSLIARGY